MILLNECRRDEKWNDRFNELLDYYNRHGHADVPLNFSENRSLATWVTNQRRKRRKGNIGSSSSGGLKAYQIAALDAIGFTWNPRKPWEVRFAELKEFKNQNGNCLVPGNDDRYRDLYVWCCNQRQQYRQLCEQGTSPLSPDRLELLVSIGFFEHDGSKMQVAVWHKRLNELKEYRDEYGNCNVSRHYAPNLSLGRWVDTQRTAYRMWLRDEKSSPLTQARIDAFERNWV